MKGSDGEAKKGTGNKLDADVHLSIYHKRLEVSLFRRDIIVEPVNDLRTPAFINKITQH